MPDLVFHPLIPGGQIPEDWFGGTLPANIVAGENSVIDSCFSFKNYRATCEIGLRVGKHVTIWRTAFSVEKGALVEIGDYCYLSNASLVCSRRISIGSHVFLAGGVTIVDSDFHPIAPAARLADTIVLSPAGERWQRKPVEALPVWIEDDVWIGYNATILKGVRVGAGAVIEPGSVVVRDVPSGARVAGSPAHLVS
jgi:acetyltransferase-like isoleucine patch superfamily enzyme